VNAGGSYTAEQRRTIAAALVTGDAACPVCGAELARQTVEPAPGVAYVRKRIWVLCPACRRTASLDVKAE
jgi:uncharacterized protein with PIN domain